MEWVGIKKDRRSVIKNLKRKGRLIQKQKSIVKKRDAESFC
jgi:hypothetical protein